MVLKKKSLFVLDCNNNEKAPSESAGGPTRRGILSNFEIIQFIQQPCLDFEALVDSEEQQEECDKLVGDKGVFLELFYLKISTKI